MVAESEAKRRALAAAQAWFLSATIEPLGRGHIHQTWQVSDQAQPDQRFVLQRINPVVYADVELLMAQTEQVLNALTRDPEFANNYQVPVLVPTAQGRPFARIPSQRDEGEDSWRLWRFVENSATFDPPQDRRQIRLAAQAFGAFQRALSAVSVGQLDQTIPGFLHLASYLKQFDSALDGASAEELAQAQPWIDLAQSHRQWPEQLSMPNAMIHGDCKINNVLFDRSGKRVLALIDLDNNMHGHWAWDFGDMVRSIAFSRGGFDPEDYRACVQGFVSGRRQRLDADALVQSPAYLAYMLGLRFLADHLVGDRYFAVPQHGDNLERAKQQFDLFAQFQEAADSMAAIATEVLSTR
jgi:aminoglycoside phosphotransferase (APT) family kinase protein